MSRIKEKIKELGRLYYSLYRERNRVVPSSITSYKIKIRKFMEENNLVDYSDKIFLGTDGIPNLEKLISRYIIFHTKTNKLYDLRIYNDGKITVNYIGRIKK